MIDTRPAILTALDVRDKVKRAGDGVPIVKNSIEAIKVSNYSRYMDFEICITEKHNRRDWQALSHSHMMIYPRQHRSASSSSTRHLPRAVMRPFLSQ